MNAPKTIRPGYSTSSNGLARAIAGIFASELQIPAADIDDNFFDLGGDSLTAETLVLAVQNRFGIKIQTSVLLAAPTPREFGRLVASMKPTHSARQLLVPVSGSSGHDVSGVADFSVHGRAKASAASPRRPAGRDRQASLRACPAFRPHCRFASSRRRCAPLRPGRRMIVRPAVST